MTPPQITTFIKGLPKTLPPGAPKHHFSHENITPSHFQMRKDPLPLAMIEAAMEAGGWHG